jgi:hypothetical protein
MTEGRDEMPRGSCKLWTKSKNSRGYGLAWDGEKSELAHRLIYRKKFGPIPNGMYVCHKCDVPLCVNPDHLFLGTPSDNLNDCIAKGRRKVMPLERAKEVKKLIENRTGTLRQLAEELGIELGVIKWISMGKRG